jgi:4-hydroxybenzoate polyprenyltransferase
MALIAAGLVWFSRIPVHGAYASDILGPSLVAALGLGLAFVPVTIAAVSGVDDREAGLASGLINTGQQIGGALGLAILSAISTSVAGSSRAPAVLTHGFHDAFLAGAGFAVLGVLATLFLVPTRDSRAQRHLGQPPAEGTASA